MDPATHTLVGFSLAEAGLKRRTAMGTAVLVVGANLPDIDVLSLLWGPETGLWFRRGATHGVLALVLLPLLLTGFLWLWARVRRSKTVRRGAVPFRTAQVLLLATTAVATHPALDFLNVYGMRWLMPFSETWWYADTLFIVDPWVWAMLAAGLYLAKQRGNAGASEAARRPPRIAIVVMAVYVMLMATTNILGRTIVARAATEQGFAPERLMVAPVAVNPFRRAVVVQDSVRYHFGTLHWLGRPRVRFADLTYGSRPDHPAAAAALRGPRPRHFLSWARFPYYQVEVYPDSYVVRIADARYAIDPERSWAATTVVVGRTPGSP